MKVVYIMGAGHIGSTILDIVLSNHPDIEGVGEISKLHRSGKSGGQQRRCACGEQLTDCPYWPRVRRRWFAISGDDNVPRYIQLQEKFERYRSAWLRLLRNRRHPSAEFAEYLRKTEALYEAISQISRRTVIVDSSLTPRRAYLLASSRRIDLHLIHLVRDGRGVIWSLKKPGKQTLTKDYRPAPAWRTTRYWLSANLQSMWIFRHMREDRRLWLRYEDFVTNPRLFLEQIENLIQVDLSSVIDLVRREQTLQTRHTVGGCRVRMSHSIRLRPDFSWKEQLPTRDRRVFWILAGWLAGRYGYAQ